MVVNFSSIVRYYSSNTNRSFYVTTPIFYVNAAPHIGHLYSAVIADAVYRYQKIKNPNRLYKFSTGTDEHGIKIQQAAAVNKIPTNEYCEKISKEYENVFKLAGIQYTDFIRTSDERHKNTVKQFWNKLKMNDCIYSSTYSGWYCVSDETFLTDNQLKLNSDGKKVSAESGHPVEWTDEQNYLFKLSKFQSDIIEWIKEGNHIKPKKFEKILLDYLLNEPLNDLSISRPTTRVKWGIKVPDDDTQTIYVWLDALVNYLTCSNLYLSDIDSKDRKFWPPTLQIIGKDILKFHGIYWPAFLIAAGLELPECLLVHSHWTVDGEKMSKSKFNVIDPIDRSSLYTMEGLRYFLLREGVAHSDGNYSDTKILRILNSELADTLGNLLSRCCAKTLNPRQIYPKIHLKQFKDIIEMDVTKNLMEALNQLPEKCEKHYDDCNFYMVVDQVMKTLHIANNFFETTKPWELIKNYKKQITAKKINAKEVPLINNENKIDKFSTDAGGNIKDKKSVSVDIETAVATSTSSATAALAISAMATATVVEQDDNDDVNSYNEIEDNIHQLETIICIVMDTLRICAIILQPIIPDICQKLLDKLNIPQTERYWEKLKCSQQQQPQHQHQQKLENIASNILSNNCNAYINYLCCNRIENEKNLGTNDSVLFRRIIIEQDKSSRIEKTNDKKPKQKENKKMKIK